VVARVIERLAVSKQAAPEFYTERFNTRKYWKLESSIRL
jgi:hypothetical protein